MARPVAKTTIIQAATIRAKKAYDDLIEKNNKTAVLVEKEKLAQPIKDAKAALDLAIDAENRERFENVAGMRVSKIVSTLAALSNTANRKMYRYTAADIDKAFDVIEQATKASAKRFADALSGAVIEAPKSVFKF